MVRVYKKTPGTRNYQNYSQESLQLAVAAYRRRDGSLMAMSERFGIPMTTIYRKSKGMNKKKVGGQTILSQTEERVLCKALFIAADWGFPLQPHFTLCRWILLDSSVHILKIIQPKETGSKPGIWPFNTLAFGDDDFAAYEIYQTQDTLSQENPTTSGGTNIHLENADEQDKPSASNQIPDSISPVCESNIISPEYVRPYPRTIRKVSKKGKPTGKSRIFTDTVKWGDLKIEGDLKYPCALELSHVLPSFDQRFVIKLTSEKKSDEIIPSVSGSSVISQVEMDCEDDRQSDRDRSSDESDDESIDALTPSKKESAMNKNSLKNGVAKGSYNEGMASKI
ncbi:hypothetical protein JTB14_021355 [Gonioctena quinquepunctata]|nr:hypothetical protein JTB14_021355 [Gonioctena quinquepunctata]